MQVHQVHRCANFVSQGGSVKAWRALAHHVHLAPIVLALGRLAHSNASYAQLGRMGTNLAVAFVRPAALPIQLSCPACHLQQLVCAHWALTKIIPAQHCAQSFLVSTQSLDEPHIEQQSLASVALSEDEEASH